MKHHLHVQVRLHDRVVEDRLCEVEGRIWLGECPGAAVAFPGAIVWVDATEDGLVTRAGPLVPGLPQVVARGPVQVALELAEPDVLPRDWSWVPDPMLLVATAAMVLAGAFADTVALNLRDVDRSRSEELAASAASEVAAEARGGGVPVREERYPGATSGPAQSWPPAATFSPE